MRAAKSGRARSKAQMRQRFPANQHPQIIQPYYRETFGYRPEDFPRALDLSNRILSLPLYPTMTNQEVEDVIRAVTKLVRFYRSAKPSRVEKCKKERVAQ